MGLNGLARLFAFCFIAFIAVFSVVFWEEHRHEWLLYLLMLGASITAVYFCIYMQEIDRVEQRESYLWNARRQRYALLVFLFAAFLFGVFVVASVVQHAHIEFEHELLELGWETTVALVLLFVLLVVLGVCAWRLSTLHWDAVTRHDCFDDDRREQAKQVLLHDTVWMIPSEHALHDASDVTHMVGSVINFREQ